MSALELKNVSYAYEKGKAVLQNVSGSLETGKMYAILGPSGPGKTTLLPLLGGLMYRHRAASCSTMRTLRQRAWNITVGTISR